MTEHPTVGIVSSLMRALSCLRPGHPSRPLEPAAHRRACGGTKGVRIEYRMCNQCHGGCSDREQCNLSPKEPGPKEFSSNMHGACFPKRFLTPSNIIKYDSKTNPSVWLEDYRLMCRAGGADSYMFIIQFLPIYLADTSKAWLDHLPQNSINC
jgi:hypothetical protein